MNDHASLNRCYRHVWSDATQSWMVAPETARRSGKGGRASRALKAVVGVLASVALSGGISTLTHAQQAPPSTTQLPVANAVARGQVNITQTNTANSAVMNVNQASQSAVVNWNTFNVGQNAQVNFNQPNSSAVTLNRVLDNNPSQVWGRITAPGQVFISNANGVYFSPTSSVDVGALTATTHSISDDDFMAGKRTFTRDGATGKVLNEGNIKAALGGYVALLAPEVQNAGVIVAQAGTVALAAGEAITLNFDPGQKLTGITTTPSAIASLVENKLAVFAPDGQIILSAIALNKLHAGVVKNSGHLEATSLVNKGGTIVLEGDDITLGSHSKIDATGPQGGGSVLVGGDWQGGGDIRQATRVTMEEGATIDASATENGDGGKVVLWSDVYNDSSITQVSGTIYARGGMLSGDGGRIETSGHVLRVDASQGDAAAPHGASGLWLFDPYNVTIASADANGAFATDGVNTDTWTPIASASSILNTTIVSKLNAGTHVTVTTTGAGADAGNITVAAPIAANNAGTGELSLIADGDIAINANINTAANLLLKAAGNISQAGSTSVSTNTANVTYWSDSDNSGAGSITLSAGTSTNQTSIVTNGGNIVMGGGANAATSSALGTNGIRLDGFTTLNAGAGNVSLRGTSTATTANGGVGLRLINSTITGYDINLVGQGPANTGGGTGGTKTTTTLTATHNINLGADLIVSGVNNDVTATAAGNISVDRAQTWSSNKLELSAGGNVSVNANLDASSGGGLTVRFGQSSVTGTGATYSVNGVNVKIALPTAANVSNFRWKQGTTGTDNELVFNNGYLAFTASANGLQNAGSTSAINNQGQLNQPNFYDLDTVNGATVGRNAWYKLTFGGYSLNFQVGTGTTGNIWNGNNATVSSGSGAAGGYLDISQYMPGIGSGPGLGPKASGTILSVLPITISSQSGQLISRYVLGSGDAYLRSDTSVKAISGTLSNVGLWVGTQDDFVGGVDSPTKTIGNFSGSGFTANTVVGQPASVLRVDEGGNGASVLFYSTDSSASATFSGCCSFTNATNINPASQEITRTSDGSYALYTGMGDLAAGATKGFTWFYVAAPSQKVNAVAQSVVSSLTTYSFSSAASQTYAYTGNAYSLATLWSSVSLNASSGSLLLQPGQATNGYSFVYAGNPVTSLTNAGTYRLQIALSSDIASNYLLNNAGAATLTITPAPLSISGSTVAPKTYDGTTTATVTPGAIDPSGFIGSETVGVTATGIFSSANAGARTVTPVYTLVNGTNGGLAQNYSITSISPINATISPANLILSGTKVYDGTTSIAGSTLTARGIGTQTFTVTGVGDASNLGSANVQTNTLISSITGLSLGTSSNGGLAANYNALSLTSSTYSITPKPLAVSGITVNDRVYNGGIQATIGTGAATFTGLISGDDVSIDYSSASGSFDTKNVGTAKPVTVTGLRLTGTSSGNYSFTSPSSLTGSITRLSSVTWVGGTTGNWFDPANWAGAAVPDLANVANVVIPVGTTVSFGSSVIAPASSGTVQIDSINAGLSSFGGLSMSAGTLQIGAGNANLYSLAHTGGTLSVGSNLNVEDAFSQTASGSIAVTGDATLTDTAGGVALGALTVGGNLGLQSSGGSITQLGALRVTGTSALTSTSGDITLTNASNDFTGAVSASGANISLRDANALALGSVTATGALTVTSSGHVTQTGPLAITGASSFTAGAGDITLANGSNDFTGAVSASGANISFRDANALALGTVTATGALTVTNSGNLTQSGPLAITGASSFTSGSGDITLSNASNDFTGAVSASGGGISLRDTNALALGSVTATGGLTVTNSGNLTQTGPLAITGASSFTAGTGDITLTNASNDFTGAVSASGGGISLRDANALALGTVTATGGLTVTNSGNLTQSGSLAITGASSFTAGAGDITLANASNDFTGALSASGANISFRDANALALGTVTATGGLTVTNSGNLTQTGPLAITGASSFTAGAGDITLSNSSNDFTGAVSASGGGISLRDANALALGTVTATGGLTVTNSGNLTQTGPFAITGSSSFTSGSGDITLSNGSNDFTGAVSASGANISLRDTNALALGTVTATGGLTVTNSGNLTQTGPLAITGTSSFTAGVGDITLADASNDFTGAVSASGGGISLRDANALALGTVTATGGLTVINSGNLTQTGPLAITGVTNVNAGAGDITLSNASNDFTGAVSVSGGGISLRDANALALGTVTATGGLTVINSGNLTQTGPLAITGASSFAAGAGDITLAHASNDFTGTLSASGANVSLRDANALTLGTLTALGSTNITTVGDVSFGSTVIRDNLSVTTGNGSISQTQTIGVSGGLTLNAGTGAVNLADTSNIFGSTPVVQAATINLAHGMPYSLTTTVTSDPQKPVFTGQAPTNSTVSIYDNGTLIATVPTDNAGNWRYESTAFMIPGTHAITLKASSAVGTSGIFSPAPVTVNARFDALNMVGAALQGQQAPAAVGAPAVAAGQSIMASADQLVGMSTQQIQAMSPQQTAMFTPTQLASLDPVQIASFSPAQLASLSVQQVAAISRVATLSFEQVQTLSPAQVASMEPAQFANMNAAEIASLGDMQLLALTPNQVAAIAPADLAAITPEQLNVLGANLTQNLSPEQFGSMTALQLVSLTDSQVSALSPVQLQQLNATQLSVLTVEQKAAMTPMQLLAIGESPSIQVAELSHQEISNLTAQQVQNLQPEQLQSLSGLQVRALSVAQVEAMGSQQVEALSPVQLQALTTEQLSSMSLVQAASLTEGQLAVMSPTQLNALPKGGVLPLTVLGDVRMAATGIEFEKRVDSLDVRVTDMAPPPILMTADNMPTELTSFTVTTAEQQVVEFKGTISNKQLIIAASTDAAKGLTRLDMARVVRAAVTELMEGKKPDPSDLTGVVLDLR